MAPFPETSRARILVGLAVVAVLAGGLAVVAIGSSDGEADTASERNSPPASPATGETSSTTGSTSSTSSTTTAATTTTTAPLPTGTDPAMRLEPVLSLDQPSAVVDTGGGRVLVSTLDGRIHRADLAQGTAEVVLDLRPLVSTGGERGLLGMAADPDGERLYVDFTDVEGDTDVRSWPMADGVPQGGSDDGVLHLEIGQPYANHNGGHLAFGPDGHLWIGTGDGGSRGDPGDRAQDPGELLGKMLRVVPDPAGGVRAPADNPAWGGRPEVWALGLRNPWRYSFDRMTGRLWIADVGQSSTEEVSVIDRSASMPNLGWNRMEGDRPYAGGPDPAFTPPVVTYGHDDGCSITGGYVYRGDDIPSLAGWYVFGDYCGGWIRAVPADDPGRAPVELASGLGPVLSFAELDDGELLALTPEGVRRLVPV